MSQDEAAGTGTSTSTSTVAVVGGRLASVDTLRGLIMVLMVLDHTRDFFTDMRSDPTNLATTTVPLFFTRWVTHFCAPLFIFLAGASAFLVRGLGKVPDRAAQARYLGARGLFLVVLELTLVRLGLFYSWSLDGMFLQVIWAIGMSLVLLALLVGAGLSPRWVGACGLLIVLAHNLLDLRGGPPPEFPSGEGAPGASASASAASLWFSVLLRPGPLALAPGMNWFVAYPLLPWFGIMALGYAYGPLLLRDRAARVRLTAALGLCGTLAFIALRAAALYGDPVPFRPRDSAATTLMAFLNCQKYPPSLLFALMTLGPGLLILAALDASEGWIAQRGGRAGFLRRGLTTLGRVPLFYYLLQWPAIHLVMVVVNALGGHPVSWTSTPFNASLPVHSLPFAYAMTALVVLLLYVPSRWYAGLKLRRKDWTWLSYL